MQQAVSGILNKNTNKNTKMSDSVGNATGANTKDKKSIVAKILPVVLWGIVIILAVALVSTIISNGEKSILGFRSFYVRTDSMSPTFNAGAWILVKEKPIEKVEPGDILTFRVKDSRDTSLTHRCIEVEKDESGELLLWTQGDANNAPDPNPVTQDRLLGETIFWINGLGYVITMLQTPPGYIFLAVLIFLMIFIPEFIGYIKKNKD